MKLRSRKERNKSDGRQTLYYDKIGRFMLQKFVYKRGHGKSPTLPDIVVVATGCAALQGLPKCFTFFLRSENSGCEHQDVRVCPLA